MGGLDRRPIKRLRYKVPHRDLCIEMRLGDLLDSKEDIVVSTNTTFETAISNGPISPKSLQGQVLLGFFDGNTEDLDRQIKASLGGIEFSEGIRRYPFDTVAKVKAHGKNLYFVAMAELNAHGTAQSDLNGVSAALAGIWSFIASRGERADLAVPVMGTGRGRLGTGQQKMIEVIAQSFADASRERIFARKLAIVVHPDDAKAQEINLFEVRDDLRRRLSA